MDAVCGKSPAVEEASTEFRAAAGRSDEPKLGSLAALPQQTSRGGRTKRSVRSSKKKFQTVHSFS